MVSAKPPEEIIVTGRTGVAWRGPRVGEYDLAERYQSVLQNAAERAKSNYPSYYLDTFGEDYSVSLDGPGLHKQEMFDGVDVPEIPGAGTLDSMLTTSQAEMIRIVSEFDDAPGVSVGKDELVFRESGLSDPVALANEVADAYGQALQNLKNQYPDNWQAWYGYTTVSVVDER